MNRRAIAIRQFVAVSLACLAALFVFGHCSGCTSPAAKEAAAEGAYHAEHMRCVAEHETNAEIDDCRAKVRERWNITTTVTRKDGGS
jgi:hypothetical protein